MEERVSVSASVPSEDDPPLRVDRSRSSSLDQYEPIFRPKPFPSRKISVKDSPLPLAKEPETYVVQMPKDQIFSVPPPENAIIAERFRNPEKEGRSSCCKRLLWIVVILAMLTLLAGIIAVVFNILFSPKAPVFAILHVNVKNASHSSGHQKENLRYEIGLKAENPNQRMGISYGSNGEIALLYKDHKIGTGKFPGLDQEAEVSSHIQLNLTGSNRGLSSEVETSVKDKKGEKHVTLTLKIKVAVEMKVGAVELWSKVSDVDCDFKVGSLGEGKNVLSQLCESKLV